jgi:hypothetical protein
LFRVLAPVFAAIEAWTTTEMTATSEKIDKLVSYAWNDWSVSKSESGNIAKLLDADKQIDQTIADMAGDTLSKVMSRVVIGEEMRRILVVIARRARLGIPTVRTAIVRWKRRKTALGIASYYSGFQVERFFDIAHHLSQAASRHGFIQRLAIASAPAPAPSDPAAPFGGVGATGTNPTQLSIGPVDQFQLWRKDSATVSRYSNPIPGSLSDYINNLPSAERLAQARTLTRQSISTLFADVYGNKPPLRSRVMWAAGRQHRLEPELIAGFILAEQRDQSRNEDAKDFVGATSVAGANTSIGLGQVVVSTARDNDLFRDLLPSHVTSSLSHNEIAALLASDEFNIFASAKYIRQVANSGWSQNISSLPNTQRAFPGIDMGKYAGHSNAWPRDNLRALASEYTSRAWDDRLSEGWGYFVNEAYNHVKGAGISFP